VRTRILLTLPPAIRSPYFQYTSATTSPGPFDKSVGLFPGDPDFSSDTTCASNSLMCNFSWAVIVEGVSNLSIASAGLYSWFDNYVQPCVDTQNCQQRIFLNNGGNEGFRLFNLITIGSVEMLSAPEDDLVIYAKDNTQAHSHPFWSMLAGYLDDGADDEVLECNDDDDSPACNGTPLCDFSQDFATLDEVQAASGSFSPACTDYYTIRALENMLQDTIGQFASADNGYDALYGYYVESVKNSVPTALDTFMAKNDGPGNQYFTCTFQAIHSGTGGNLGKPITHTCPMTVKDFGFNEAFTIAYTLNDEDGFFNALESQYGIERDWVKFDTQFLPVVCPQGASCFGQGIYYLNYPMASDKINVANPKDTVTAALANMPATQDSIAAREADIMGGQWIGSTNDIVSVVSMPVMMLQQAIDSMNNAKALAKTQKAEDKKNLIIEILSAVLIFIPFLDDIAPAALAAARIGTLIGDAGSLAITIQEVVSDPSSAPLAILGVLGAAGATLSDASNMARLASARRGISDGEIEGLGSKFKSFNDKLSILERPSCKF
jgi:glucan 1,3-beta-glucosidase